MEVENMNYTLVEKIENVFKTLYENKNIFPKEFFMDLQYVIDMLVNNQSNSKDMTATRIVVERNIYEMQKLNEERYERQIEEYKKIAEKLADTIAKEHTNTLYEFEKARVSIIDWARKEVM